MCYEGHATSDCVRLKALQYSKKLETFRSKGLCFKCVEQGHIVRDCEKEVKREVSGCKKRHATLLHRESKHPNH